MPHGESYATKSSEAGFSSASEVRKGSLNSLVSAEHPSLARCASSNEPSSISPNEKERDRRMSLSNGSILLSMVEETASSKSSQTSKSSPSLGKTEKAKTTSLGFETKSTSVNIADEQSAPSSKKAFILSLMKPCANRGYLTCSLCGSNVWGPNGRYHINKCPVLCRLRDHEREGLVLCSVNGIRVYHEFFSQPKPMKRKYAKIDGFVMSSTVLRDNPFKSPTIAQQKMGAATGRKGYTRCLSCNAEVFAPNTVRHKAVCKGT